MSGRAALSLVLLALLPAAVPAAAQPAAAPVVTSSIDRPAIWVADRVVYTVNIVCPRGVDVLIDDLGRDKLKLTGLEVVGTETRRRDEAGVTRYGFDYVLTTYRIDIPTLSIGSFQVRYYLARAGQRPEEAAPAGAVTVPAATIAFRSLLPDDQAIYDVRDSGTLPARWLPYRLLGPAGLVMILLAAAPAALALARPARALRRRRDAPPSARHTRQAARAALAEMRDADAADPTARRAAFARLDALVREHVAGVCGVPAAGLTPEELDAALEPCRGRIPIELVGAVLASCELARYAGPELRPSPDTWRDTIAKAEQVLSAR